MGVWGAHMVISWFIMSLTYFLAEHCYSTDLTARWQQLRRIYASATVKFLVLAIRPENINKNKCEIIYSENHSLNIFSVELVIMCILSF